MFLPNTLTSLRESIVGACSQLRRGLWLWPQLHCILRGCETWPHHFFVYTLWTAIPPHPRETGGTRCIPDFHLETCTILDCMARDTMVQRKTKPPLLNTKWKRIGTFFWGYSCGKVGKEKCPALHYSLSPHPVLLSDSFYFPSCFLMTSHNKNLVLIWEIPNVSRVWPRVSGLVAYRGWHIQRWKVQKKERTHGVTGTGTAHVEQTTGVLCWILVHARGPVVSRQFEQLGGRFFHFVIKACFLL